MRTIRTTARAGERRYRATIWRDHRAATVLFTGPRAELDCALIAGDIYRRYLQDLEHHDDEDDFTRARFITAVRGRYYWVELVRAGVGFSRPLLVRPDSDDLAHFDDIDLDDELENHHALLERS